MNAEQRYSRQKQLVPINKLDNLNAPMIIGVGAIGRNVAIQLAAIGVKNITIVDDDSVEESNIASQGYLEADLNTKKVEATKRICQAINSSIEVQSIDTKFKKSMCADVVFMCVDSIATREFIWKNLKDKTKLFIDGRMAAELFRIITVENEIGKIYYPTTLFSESETYVGSCTAKSTIYCSNIAAGFMVQAFTKWLRNFKNDLDVSYNLLGNELIVRDERTIDE